MLGDLRWPFAIVLLSAIVTASAAWQAYRTDAEAYRAQFERDAAEWAEQVAARIDRGLTATRAAAGAVGQVQVFDPEIAGLLVADRMGPESPLDAAGWLPLPPSQGAMPSFTIHARGPAGATGARENVAGDFGEADRARLRSAAGAGRPAVLWLPAGPGHRIEGLLLAVPVEAGLGQSQPVRAAGFAFGIVSSTELAAALRRGDLPCPLAVDVLDPHAPAAEATLHRLTAGAAGPGGPWRRLLAAGWRGAGTLRRSGGEWSLAVSPTPAHRIAHHSFASALILVVGALLVAFFLVDHFRNTRPTRARLRRLLDERAQGRAAAEALQESERKYRELVEHANSIILHLSRDGAITFLNEYGQRFFGWAAAEIVGKPVVGTLVPEEEGGRDLRRLLEEICADPERHQRNVNQNVCRDGRRVWVAWNNKAVFDADGALAGVFSVGSDITEQREAEEALRRARQELEQRVVERTAELSSAKAEVEQRATELAVANVRLQELDRLKSEFLAIMSHELRTPLNSVIGFTGILRQGLAGPINAEQAKQLGMVHASATHLLSLINDLLDLSRIEANKVDLDRRPFDFRDVVAEVEASCHPALAQKGLAFRAELPGQELRLLGDRKRCFQVLLNLVGNAVKFTERGEIRVTAGLSADGGDRLRVAVTDTGIGIRPEHLGMLFEAFRQVDGSARRVYEGTGLGLHLCRKLLELMGGEISVESTFGQGSRFTFTLPTTLRPAAETEARA